MAGYTESVLEPMHICALDLETLQWTRHAGLASQSVHELPVARQRSACAKMSAEWLLVCGGSPSSVRCKHDRLRGWLAAVSSRLKPRRRLLDPTSSWICCQQAEGLGQLLEHCDLSLCPMLGVSGRAWHAQAVCTPLVLSSSSWRLIGCRAASWTMFTASTCRR